MRLSRYRPRLWAAGTFVAVAGLAAGILSPQASATDRIGPTVQIQPEDDGADCPVPNPTTVDNSKLPDLFLKMDGTRATTRSDWRCRRAEIKKTAEAYVYGTKHGRPSSVTGSATSSSITVNVSDQGKSASFSASVSLPSGTGPFPAVVVLGGFGADTSTITSAGAAVISYARWRWARRARPATTSKARTAASTARRAAPGCWPPGPGA